MENLLSYDNLLLENNSYLYSIGHDLQTDRIPSSWFSPKSSSSRNISIIQFIHRLSPFFHDNWFFRFLFAEFRHRFNEYFSWRKSLKEIKTIDCQSIHRTENFISLICLDGAIRLNTTQDKVNRIFFCHTGIFHFPKDSMFWSMDIGNK